MVNKALKIFIGFLHDFAAGCWAASLLAIWWIEKAVAGTSEMENLLVGLQREFFFAGLVCVGIVLLAGAGRTFTYAAIGSVYGEDAEPLRRKMLIIKHVVLFAVFGSGIWWQYTMVFR